MTAPATAEIDAYLATLPPDLRAALTMLRRAILRAAPEVTEAISYGAPAVQYRGRPLVAYRAARDHASFFPMDPAVIKAHRDELAGFATSKGTIRFSATQPIPEVLVRAIVRERMAEIDRAGRPRRAANEDA